MSILFVVKSIFTVYTLLLFIRIALSWLPSLYKYEISRFVVYLTDPYMNIFKKIIPPIGGFLDLSPMLAFFSLRFIESFILSMLR